MAGRPQHGTRAWGSGPQPAVTPLDLGVFLYRRPAKSLGMGHGLVGQASSVAGLCMETGRLSLDPSMAPLEWLPLAIPGYRIRYACAASALARPAGKRIGIVRRANDGLHRRRSEPAAALPFLPL